MTSIRRGPLVAVLSAAVFGAGCFSTHHVPRPQTPEDLQKAIAATGGPVTLLSGPPAPAPLAATQEVRPLAINPEGILVASGAEQPQLLQVKDLRGYEVRRHKLSTLQGIGIGLVAGAAAGAAIGYGAPNDFLSRNNNVVYGAVVWGLLGAITGGLIGGVIGHNDLYLFDPPR